jgi:hypothetical protein
MSKRRYHLTLTDPAALKAAYPNSVIERTIPARVEHSPVYTIVAALLDAGIEVPGITVTERTESPSAPAQEAAQPLATAEPETGKPSSFHHNTKEKMKAGAE